MNESDSIVALSNIDVPSPYDQETAADPPVRVKLPNIGSAELQPLP